MSSSTPHSPYSMSPRFTSRNVRIHGSSVPSSRAIGGGHEDHHSNSGLDLSSLDDDAAINTSGSSSSRTRRSLPHSRKQSDASEPGSPFLLSQLDKSKAAVPDEFELDSTRSAADTPKRFSFDKAVPPQPHESEDSDADDEAKAGGLLSPSEQSAASSPAPVSVDTQAGAKKEGRLLIIANRLPVSMKVVKKPAGDGSGKSVNEISFSSSSGGLVSALGGCDMESRWIGWPGAEVKRSADRDNVRSQLSKQNCVPVFLPQKICDPFYNGFCNNVLWPLYHYIPLPVESITTADAEFEAYQLANQAFADVVLRIYQEGDVVWVHDYHLMLLPRLLRSVHPNMKIGFFFHTPFPSFEIYRMMPAREQLLEGVLSSNLIGFHTPDYQRHFVSSCQRILGATHSAATNELTYDKFTAKLGAFPIGIDPKRFVQSVESDKIKQYMEQYRREFGGKKVLLGIDRLDYIKGIQHKIYALEKLFEKYPSLAHEVVLVQIAVPSRTEVVEYQKLRAATHKLVARVNGRYGSIGSQPVNYLDQTIPFDRMCALYRVADAMVVTSVRDGMNLVAYEYIACQKDGAGVLILSEFAGAAQSLGSNPLVVNPWSINSVSEAMRTALTMPEVQRRDRCAAMFHHVITHSSSAWARSFLTGLLVASNLPLTWLKDLGESTPVDDDWQQQQQQQQASVKHSPHAPVQPVNKASDLPPPHTLTPTAVSAKH